MANELLQGHKQFLEAHSRDERSFLSALGAGKQAPGALYVGCSDSRVVPELLTKSSPGTLFVVRNVANLVPDFGHLAASVGAAIEYGVKHLHVPHIIVCGHYGCGGVRAAMDGLRGLEDLPSLTGWLTPAVPVTTWAKGTATDVDAWWRRAVEENVLMQLHNLTTYPVVREAMDAGQLHLHGWVYDIATLALSVYDTEDDAFVPADALRRDSLPG